MTGVRLRVWQRQAYDRFLQVTGDDSPDFLAVATPGAGKTTFALVCARAALAEHRRRIVVVAPTSHLKLQWSRAAARLGLQLDPDWTPGGGIAPDVHGIVTTYQQVSMAGTATILRGVASDAFVILDELHHAGDEHAWGDAVRLAFSTASRRLCLSGTPFRSDTAAIPFVRYVDGEALPDYEYGYGDALRDGDVVRPVYFPRVDGNMEWSAPDGSVLSATFQDQLARDGTSQRLRAALSLDGDWLPHVIGQADARLTSLRRTDPDAGGLVITMDQEHAHGVAGLLRRRFGVTAGVVVSDDPGASRKITDFAESDEPWLVAVRMVSEGVDIARLRVGVYASTVATELFFRQAVGRFVRWQSGRLAQRSFVYVPDDVRLRTHAFRIMEARRHVLVRHAVDPSPTDDGADVDPAPLVNGDTDGEGSGHDPEQLSLFNVLSAVATGTQIHAVTPAGLLVHDMIGVDELDHSPGHTGAWPDHDGSDRNRLALELELELPEIPTDAGWTPHDGPVFELKDGLRTRNAEVAKRLVDLTGWGHGRVNGEMNRLASVSSVTTATVDQLTRRLRRSQQWLDQLRSRHS